MYLIEIIDRQIGEPVETCKSSFFSDGKNHRTNLSPKIRHKIRKKKLQS